MKMQNMQIIISNKVSGHPGSKQKQKLHEW